MKTRTDSTFLPLLVNFRAQVAQQHNRELIFHILMVQKRQ